MVVGSRIGILTKGFRMQLDNKYPDCNCGEDHYYFTCECGNHSFHITAAKKLTCSTCHNIFDLSKILAMLKKTNH